MSAWREEASVRIVKEKHDVLFEIRDYGTSQQQTILLVHVMYSYGVGKLVFKDCEEMTGRTSLDWTASPENVCLSPHRLQSYSTTVYKRDLVKAVKVVLQSLPRARCLSSFCALARGMGMLFPPPGLSFLPSLSSPPPATDSPVVFVTPISDTPSAEKKQPVFFELDAEFFERGKDGINYGNLLQDLRQKVLFCKV